MSDDVNVKDLWKMNKHLKKEKSADDMFRYSEDRDDTLHDVKVKQLTTKRDTLLSKKKDREEIGGLKREIRQLRTDRYAKPVLSGGRKILGVIKSSQRSLSHGVRHTHHGRSSHNLGVGHSGSGLGLTDLSSSKVGSSAKDGMKVKKEHYLDW